MNKKLNKKLITSLTIILFFGLTIIPMSNAESDKTNYITKLSNNSENILYPGESIYKLLIISPKEFVNVLQPLVVHKNSYGMSTKLVTLCEVYDQMYWFGRDNAEKIKYYIKNAIEEWGVKYVLLVGGMKGQLLNWYLPIRYIHMDCNWESKIISDTYFADIYDSKGNFSSWNFDEDERFGEWYYEQVPEDKYIDLYPDVAVGRIPCRNKFEVRIMVNKIIKYETTTYNKEWFYNMIVFAGDTYPEIHDPLWVGYEGEFYGDRAIENMTGFNPIRIYTSDGSLRRVTDIIKAMRNGAGFVYFVGHGSPKSWGNHPPNSDEFVGDLDVTNVHRLRNKDMLPVCLLSGCHNLQFDVSNLKFFDTQARFHGEAVKECLGWRITRKIGGGSIATIGCSALGFTKEDKDSFEGGINELEVEFFKQYGQNNVDILGDAWRAALDWYIDTYPITLDDWNNATYDDDVWVDVQIPQTWILFGDPSLKIGGYPQ